MHGSGFLAERLFMSFGSERSRHQLAGRLVREVVQVGSVRDGTSRWPIGRLSATQVVDAEFENLVDQAGISTSSSWNMKVTPPVAKLGRSATAARPSGLSRMACMASADSA